MSVQATGLGMLKTTNNYIGVIKVGVGVGVGVMVMVMVMVMVIFKTS